MKVHLSLLFVILFSHYSYAFNTYKCKAVKRIELAACGHYAICKNRDTGKEIINPIVYQSSNKMDYTILSTENEIILKRVFDGHMHKLRKKNAGEWYIGKNSIRVVNQYADTLVLNNGEFYFIKTPTMGFIDYGTCKLE